MKSTNIATTSRKLMINTLLNLVNQAVTALINFGMVGFFLEFLGEARYGVWILIGSIFSYRSLTFMGLNSAVNRLMPIHLVNNDAAGISRVLSTAFAYYMLPSAIVAIATALFYVQMEAWFNIESALIGDAKQAVAIMGASFAIALPLQVYNAALSSYQRYDIMNAIAITAMLLRTAVVVALVTSDYGLAEIALTYGLAEVVIRVISMFSAIRIMKGALLRIRDIDLSLLPEMMTYGASTLLYMSSAVLIFKSADLVIGSQLSTASVSQFYIATTPVLLLATFIQVYAQAMKPAVSDLDARNDTGRIEQMAMLSQKYSLFAIIPGVAFLVLMGESFLKIWVGERMSDPSVIPELVLVLQALAIGTGLRLSQHTNFIVLVGKGSHRVFGLTGLAMWISSIFLAIAAERELGLGLVGIAWACACPMILVSTTILPVHFMREMGISLNKTLRESWGPAITSSVPGVVLLTAWSRFSPPETWFMLLLSVAVAAGATAVTAWYFGIKPAERSRLRRLVSR